MKNFKIRRDLSIKAYGRDLFRIEATQDIKERGVKKGDIGGYIEKEENLYGNAWVFGNARVYGNAEVYGNARIFGNARVFDDAEVCGDEINKRSDVYNITANSQYDITITPLFMKIGCQWHTQKAWFNFTDVEIRKMDGETAVEWWRQWKPILMAICGLRGDNK